MLHIPQTTLADSFLDDLDELGDSSDDEKEEEVKKEGSKPKTDSASAMDMAKDLDDLDDDSDDDDDDDDAEAGFEDMLGDEDDTGVASVATLRASFRFKEHMEVRNRTDLIYATEHACSRSSESKRSTREPPNRLIRRCA